MQFLPDSDREAASHTLTAEELRRLILVVSRDIKDTKASIVLVKMHPETPTRLWLCEVLDNRLHELTDRVTNLVKSLVNADNSQ